MPGHDAGYPCRQCICSTRRGWRSLMQKKDSLGGTMMRNLCVASAIVAVFCAGGAVAQQPQTVKLDDTQTLGRNLFLQSCGECHLLPQLGAPRYAPQLTRESLGGNEY